MFSAVESPRYKTGGGDASENSLLSSAGTGWHESSCAGIGIQVKAPIGKVGFKLPATA